MLDTPRITTAFELAARVHARQRRTGTKIPYIAHPMAVASQVLVWGGNEDQFIAALLHDVLEDGGAQYVPVSRVRRRLPGWSGSPGTSPTSPKRATTRSSSASPTSGTTSPRSSRTCGRWEMTSICAS